MDYLNSSVDQKSEMRPGRLSYFLGSKSHEAETEVLAGRGFFLETSEENSLPSAFKGAVAH